MFLMHLEMHNVSQCPRGQKGQEAEKQTKGWMLFCVFLSPGRVFLFPVFFNEKDWKQKKLSPGSSKTTTIHRKHHRCRHYPRSPQLQCCAWKCRTLWTKMVAFFEGRHTHNLEYNIELGDGGNMTCMVLNFIAWPFFFEEPGILTYLDIFWHLPSSAEMCRAALEALELLLPKEDHGRVGRGTGGRSGASGFQVSISNGQDYEIRTWMENNGNKISLQCHRHHSHWQVYAA